MAAGPLAAQQGFPTGRFVATLVGVETEYTDRSPSPPLLEFRSYSEPALGAELRRNPDGRYELRPDAPDAEGELYDLAGGRLVRADSGFLEDDNSYDVDLGRILRLADGWSLYVSVNAGFPKETPIRSDGYLNPATPLFFASGDVGVVVPEGLPVPVPDTAPEAWAGTYRVLQFQWENGSPLALNETIEDVTITRLGDGTEFVVAPASDPDGPYTASLVDGELLLAQPITNGERHLRVRKVGPYLVFAFGEGTRTEFNFTSYDATVGISLPLPTEAVLAPAELATGVRVRQETAEGYLYQFQTAAQAGGPWTNVGAPLPGGPVIEQFFELPPGQKFHRFEVTLRPVTPAP